MTAPPPDPEDPTGDSAAAELRADAPIGRPWGVAGQGPGSRIGRYELLEQVGEGGMGVVYRAVSKQPVRREVALKLCKAPLDAREVLVRFEAERQALATLDHPAIATLLDGGTTDDGRPYFVMEFVEGPPVDVYADQHRMTLEQRLELFATICDAVQHAHQNGIIHRDIKPSNVLVQERDGKPQPKVIDFGVAKAIAQPLTERTLFTHFGVLVGTPAFMSPEQLRKGAAAVDTRTDVYSLGAVLYQLVTGAALVDPQQLRGAGFDEIVRLVCEAEPRSLVERIRSQGDTTSALASRRGTSVRELLRGVQGDLQWIVHRSLAKNRDERYASAAELASDVRRLLAGEPTIAHPPSFGYQLGKLMARHRGLFVAGTMALVLATLFVIALLVQSRNLDAARARAERTSGFLEGMLTWLDPTNVDGTTVSLEQVLDEADERIASELGDAPQVALNIRRALGDAYLRQGHPEKAAQQAEAAVALARRTGDAQELQDALANLAICTYHSGRPKEAWPLAEQAIAASRQAGEPDDERVAQLLGILGEAAYRLGDLQEAGRRLDQALAVQEQVLLRSGAPGDSALARRLGTAGAIARRLGDGAKGRALLQRAIEVLDSEAGRDDGQRAWTLIELAAIDRADLHWDDSDRRLAEAVAIYERLYGTASHLVGTALGRQGEAALERYRLHESRALLTRGLAILESARGPNAAETIGVRSVLAALEVEAGAPQRALEFVRQHEALNDALAAEIGQRPHREINDRLIASRALLALGRATEAVSEARKGLELMHSLIPDNLSLASQARLDLANALRSAGQLQEAEREAQAAVDAARNALREGDPARARAKAMLGELLLDRGDCAGARSQLAPALRVLRPLLSEPSSTRTLAVARERRLADSCSN